MAVVLGAHHGDRALGVHGAGLAQQREEDLLLADHVGLQVLGHLHQQRSQAARAFGAVAMDLLHARGQADQLGQLLAVDGVVALQQVRDQLVGGRLTPVLFVGPGHGLQRGQAVGDVLRVDAALGGGLAQRMLAAAAEVEPVFMEHLRRPRDAARQLAQRCGQDVESAHRCRGCGKGHGDQRKPWATGLALMNQALALALGQIHHETAG